MCNMPRWKATEQILNLSKDGEFFDENWMNYDKLWQYAPKPIPWDENRSIRFEDVDLWEVITEESNNQGFFGVYAAYQPYAEYYIVTHKWSIVQEFEGWMANERLEKFLIEKKINYPVATQSPTLPKNKVIKNKIFIHI